MPSHLSPSQDPAERPGSAGRRRHRGKHRAPRRRRRWPIVLLLIIAVTVATAAAAAVLPRTFRTTTAPATSTPSPTPTTPAATTPAPQPSPTPSQPSPTPSPTPPADIHLTIGYAGDLLMHLGLLRDTPGGKGDISALTTAATPWTSGVDLALCSMEVPVSPDGSVSGYPTFGTPVGVVNSLPASGWDGCATASNHSWDQGWDGLVATADAMEANHLGFAGTNRTEAEAARPYQLYTLQRDGRTITIAQLDSTYGLNGFTADPAWAVQLNNAQWVTQQAQAARAQGADIVVVQAHLGEEYSRDPVRSQTTFARQVAAGGAVDLLFLSHPHVPQTNELLEGGPNGSGMWVSYSAGNFISNQAEQWQGTVMCTVGLFVWADLTVTQTVEGQRSVRVDALHWHPFTVDRLGGHKLIDLAAAHAGTASRGSLSAAEVERRWKAVTDVVNPETYSDTVPTPTGEPPTALPRAAQ